MKRSLLHTFIFYLFYNLSFGQVIPSSSKASNCFDCVPSQWNKISGQPSISDNATFSMSNETWNLPSPPSGNSHFITERHNASGHHDVVSTTITGLVPGRNYKVSFNVTTADPKKPNASGGYSIAKTATVKLNNNGVIITKTTSYNGSLDPKVAIWTHNEIVFQAQAATADLEFTGTADWIYNPATEPFDCPFPAQICPPKYGVIGLDVEGIEQICNVSNDQVVLQKVKMQNVCPATTVNLNSALSSPAPNGLVYVWYQTQNHTGSAVGDPTKVSYPGSYYAFLYDAVNSCYNTNASQAKVDVTIEQCCSLPANQVQLSSSSISNVCPAIAADLNTAFTGAPPHNSELVWYTNANHSGSPVSNPSSVGTGTYYAFFHNWVDDCFNTSNSTAAVNVQITMCICKAGTDQVKLSSATATNKCSATTVDLTSLNLSNIPQGTSLVWYTNPTHTGSPIANPSAVAAGTYYAFIYDSAMDCYNTASSTAQVKVTINPCATNVPLNIKVALQGAMPSSGLKMKNELQTYGGTGLLPTAAPYGMLSSYPDINKIDGVAGEVVDWISVEIRSGSSPQTVLQTKSLLLKTTGVVVDVNGQTPTFNPQTGSVRVVLKHRNHLAIMSNPIQNFNTGTVASYDFTTALSQASNDFGDPPQMVEKNGLWCMWAGDVGASQNFGIDASDMNGVYDSNKQGAFDTYIITDVNMDGGVDANDRNLIYLSNLTGSISTIINY